MPPQRCIVSQTRRHARIESANQVSRESAGAIVCEYRFVKLAENKSLTGNDLSITGSLSQMVLELRTALYQATLE